MTFNKTIDASFLDHEVEVEITYEVKPSYIETPYRTHRASEIEVTHTRYMEFGVEFYPEGKLWQRLEWLAQEAAEEHFSESGEAA